jgi:hypothetical protein
MSNISETLNKYLRAIFDVEDSIYKSIISDSSGVPAGTINNPMDYNIGAIAGMLEWMRNLSIDLVDQLFLNLAEGKWLDFIAHRHIGIVRYSGESDVDYISRIQKFIMADKVSPASIIYYTTPFSSPGAPQILEGEVDAAFAYASFSDNYDLFQNQSPGPQNNWWIMPAIPVGASSVAFFFVLRLENTSSADIEKVIDIVDRWKAEGIGYRIQIIS